MFLLHEWYLDVVSDEGAVAICHAARLRWEPLRRRYASVLFAAPGVAPRERATYRSLEWPRETGDTVTWQSTRLRIVGRWRRDAAPIERALVDHPREPFTGPATCPAPASACKSETRSLRDSDTSRSSASPSRPGSSRSARFAGADIRPRVISWCGSRGRERMSDAGCGSTAPRSPPRRSPRPASRGSRTGARCGWSPIAGCETVPIGGPLPASARRLAGPVGRMHEDKRLARSALVHDGHDGRSLDSGWTVHEVVTW
jgi:hypothetical protein